MYDNALSGVSVPGDHYVSSQATFETEGGTLVLSMDSEMPRDGRSSIAVTAEEQVEATIRLRIPTASAPSAPSEWRDQPGDDTARRPRRPAGTARVGEPGGRGGLHRRGPG